MEIAGEKPTEKADSERHGLGCLQEMQEKALFLLISLSTLIVFVGFIKGVNKTVWYEEKRRDCIFYYEERDMGATVPTCKIDPGYAYGECPCSPGCRYYLSMDDAYTILRKQLGIKEITCGNCRELFVNHNSDESFCSLADSRQVFLKRGQKRPEWCPKRLK